jgi:hypothetical protein
VVGSRLAEILAAVLGEGLGLGRQVGEDEADELGFRRELERWVEPALEADDGPRLAAQALATGRAAEVRREDVEVVGQCEESRP